MCVVYQEVVREISMGDSVKVIQRLEVIDGLPVLALTNEALELADLFMATKALPASMRTDAIHLALAAAAKVDYLMTWNCKHLANAQILKRLEKDALRRGVYLPRVCTPLELMEGVSDDDQ